jgi:PAS domain S-box-containing protein
MALVALDGRWLQVNRSLCEITGYAEHELLGMTFQQITHPDDLEVGHALGRQLLDGDIRHFDLEKRYLHKDGRVLWILLSVSLVRDEQGRPLYFVSQVQDVTEKKRMEDELREWKSRYEAAVFATGQVLYDYDAAADRVTYGGDVEGVLGYAPQEMGPERAAWVDLIHPDDRAGFTQEAQRHLTSRTPLRLEYRVRRKDATYITVEDRGHFPPNAAGDTTRVVGLVVDVTERHRLEGQLRQAQKMEVVGRLAGGVAHDFNNLLTVISGYTELALRGLPPQDPTAGLLAEIRGAAERAASLTRQLLAFGRRSLVQPRVLDLNAALASSESLLRRLIGEDIVLEARLGPDMGSVRADPAQLGQVVMNLAVNARDAMPRGGRLTLTTSSATIDEDQAAAYDGVHAGRFAVVEVQDSGCGMTEEVKAHIFEPFFTTKGVGEGTGLGLATVYAIVQEAGGFVEVDSEVGRGTTFRVFWPSAGVPVPVAQAVPPPPALPRGSETILLAEDEDGVRSLARQVLTGCGYTLREACDGGEAIRAGGEMDGGIGLLVTDVVMPHAGGPEVAAALRARHPGLKVLYMSGHADDAVVRHGVKESAVHFLPKPFTPAALAQKVREVLDGPSRN